MNCTEAAELIDPYVDGELDLVKTLDIENHIRNCAKCAAMHRNIATLRSSMREQMTYFRAPVGLEQRIRMNIPELKNEPRGMAFLFRKSLAIAAGIALVVTTIWLSTRMVAGNHRALLAAEVTSAHVRSLMADHLWDVRSTDQHTVKPWFDGKLDFAPDVGNFAEASYSLEGGRLDYLLDRPVAALVYLHQKHFINLFIWPAAGESDYELVAANEKGYVLLHWVHAGMNYWAISDMNEDGLRSFARVVASGKHAATKPTN